jgi:sugar transferase (PEP-CTERM/EpsH1 system associated)
MPVSGAPDVHILWLKTELLHPLDKGGRIRTYQMLRHLVRDHRVSYLTLDDGRRDADAVERAHEYCTDLVRLPVLTATKGSPRFYGELASNLLSGLPYAIAKYRSSEMEREVVRRSEGGDSIDLLVCDFLAPAVNVPDSLQIPTVLFQHNVEALIWERHAAVATHPLRRAYLRRQWRRMVAFERAQCRRFDHVVAVSAEDAAWFAREYGVSDVSSVSTGVDTEYFRPTGTERQEPRRLIYTGSMDWMPNADAVSYFTDAILPAVAAEAPDVSLDIVGRNPSPAVLSLARDPRVRVTGTVPDVRPYLEAARVFIVPLRVGGGTRLKIFEAMAMEKAIVTTAVGAEGLPVRDGEHVLLADTPAAFAKAVVRLLRDPAYAAALGAQAAQLVRSRFGWHHATEQFADICMSTLAAASPNIKPVSQFQ